MVTEQQKRTTLIALLVVFLLSALDMTIISTAMPRIIEDLNGLELYAWVTTAYMLTSTVLVPIYGKLGDLYGRKRILVIGVSIFLLGSALCGLSGEFGTLPILGDGMQQLIIFRAVKGVGGAALFTSAMAIIADLYAPRERARFVGLFGAVFGLATIIGPAIGGFLTDFATVTLFGHEVPGWRWVFYVNLPLGFVALFMIIAKTPNTNHASGGRVDYLGATLLVMAFVPFLLALTWGGHEYAWDSLEIAEMLGGAALALALFVLVERKAEHPVIPLELFRNPAFTITNLTTFVVGMAFLGVVMFMPLYMQVVQGVNATTSGMALFPLMMGMMVSSIVSGRLVSRLGFYKSFIVGGNLVLVLGVILFTRIGPDTTTLDLAWRMAVVGFGLGPTQSLTNLVVQSAVAPSQLGVATSSTQFFRQIGSTIGIALFGTFLTHNLVQELPRQLPSMPGMSAESIDLSQAQSQAMNPDLARLRIEARFEEFYGVVDRAYHGDEGARQEILDNPALPEQLKEAVASAAQASPEQVEQNLALLHVALKEQAAAFSHRFGRGIKVAFSNAITNMFATALWIVIIGTLISCFIPVFPLRSQAARPAARATDSQEEVLAD
ncbi:MDR family MFS transporter [Gilvimarinus sp. F26214L]|uniref:MDR family MFS transporter n=1 Tax=Gilvimarinus sp. DZF01 TaxID=3461371 RepID=UPI0040467545